MYNKFLNKSEPLRSPCSGFWSTTRIEYTNATAARSIWGVWYLVIYLGSRDFTIKKAYEALQGKLPVSPLYKCKKESCVLWNTQIRFLVTVKGQAQHKKHIAKKTHAFKWLFLSLPQHCSEETLMHLFFTCSFCDLWWAFLEKWFCWPEEGLERDFLEKLSWLLADTFGLTEMLLLFMVLHFLSLAGREFQGWNWAQSS